MIGRIDEALANDQREEPPKTIYNASSMVEIQDALAELQTKEANVTTQLNKLLASQQDLRRELGRLDLFRANLSTQSSKMRTISNGMLADTSATATRISSSVKSLDLEQARVRATLAVVEQVSELKACVLGVAGSMGAAQDWETAASYLSRASKIPKEIVKGEFAARTVPTAEVPDAPDVTLENASEALCGLFLREFDKAVRENDGGRITRFFKLFPMINREEVGLDVYGRYVCQGVAARARTNLNSGTGGSGSKDGFFYANALTRLFEHIAQIIDGHGGLVERHYGAGSMTKVIERLQVEADMQGGIILDTWADDRRIDRHLTDVKSYPYSFLVQSFLPVQRGSVGTPRSSSPAPKRTSEDEGVDMKEVDALLNEMTLMLGKWSLYSNFVAERCKSPSTSLIGPTQEGQDSMPSFMVNSSLARKVQDRLISPFNILTTFFFRRSVEKAFQLDEQPPDLSLNPHKPLNSNPPHTTSAIDDIMFILNKVLQQSVATAQLAVVLSAVPTLARVMSVDFLGMIQRKMRDESYPRAAIQGALPPEHTIVAFLVLINNLDVAMEYVDQVIRKNLPRPSSSQSESEHSSAPPPNPNSTSLTPVVLTSTLTSFNTTFAEKTTTLLSEGLAVLFTNVLKPRLRPILLDAFRDADYQPTSSTATTTLPSANPDDPEDEDSDSTPNPATLFARPYTSLLTPLARLLTPRTLSTLLRTHAIPHLAALLERRIWTYTSRINSAGALRLERDVRAIIGVVVQQRGEYSSREAFTRCVQICNVMNLDAEEWAEMNLQGESGWEGVADRLSAEERERARAMVGNGGGGE